MSRPGFSRTKKLLPPPLPPSIPPYRIHSPIIRFLAKQKEGTVTRFLSCNCPVNTTPLKSRLAGCGHCAPAAVCAPPFWELPHLGAIPGILFISFFFIPLEFLRPTREGKGEPPVSIR
jgi:hypothetical protein